MLIFKFILIFIKKCYIFVPNATIMIHQEFINVLKTLAPFTEKDLSAASRFFNVEEIKKNDYFLKEEQVTGKIGFVVSGIFRCFHNIRNKEITTEFLFPGSIAAGMLSFLSNEPQRENIIALENTLLTTITREDLFKLYARSWKWQQMGRILAEYNYMRIEKRSICLQTLNARDRLDKLREEMPELFDKRRVPLQYIASYLGMSAETYSRIRAK